MERVETGMFARSKAGHDKGKLYIILRTEGEYVYLTDGKLRPMANPKKKKIKHIQPMYRTPEGRDLTKITDVDVKRAIVLHEKEDYNFESEVEEHVKSGCN